MLQVPVHGRGDALVEAVFRLPAQLALELGRVDGVAAVVAGAVGHVGDLAAARLSVSARTALVQQRADRPHHLDVLLLRVAADVVGLTDRALGQHGADRLAVVGHEQPVAHLFTVAIDRQRLAGQGLGDHQRDEFFREVVRAVVVGTVGGQHRQPVGVVEGADQVVGGGLGGRVRGIGRVRRGLGEQPGFAQAAVDLVGGHVQEAERVPGRAFQPLPVVAHRLQQGQGADHVGLHEGRRAVDRTVHVAFGGEIHHSIGAMFGQQPRHQGAVADIAMHEHMLRVALQRGQGVAVAGIGQRVEVDHALAARHGLQHEIASDEAGAAGHEPGCQVGYSCPLEGGSAEPPRIPAPPFPKLTGRRWPAAPPIPDRMEPMHGLESRVNSNPALPAAPHIS